MSFIPLRMAIINEYIGCNLDKILANEKENENG